LRPRKTGQARSLPRPIRMPTLSVPALAGSAHARGDLRMDRLMIWIVLGVVYGGVLYLLVQLLGQQGVIVWLALVVVVQVWLARRARGY
jgi:hypothetical protein